MLMNIINGSNFWMEWINNKKYKYLILSNKSPIKKVL